MAKKQKVLAYPPAEYQWVTDFDDLEKLSVIFAKMKAITNAFSSYEKPSKETPVHASEIYGFWYIFRDICEDLGDILKLNYWTGEIGIRKNGEGEES